MAENNIKYIADTDMFEIKKNINMKVLLPANEFGNADTNDVAVGKTFTSSNGVRLTGTMKNGDCVQLTTITIPAGRMKGDVNFDGVVDDLDAYMIYQEQIIGEEDRLVADINDDKTVTTFDGNFIQQQVIPKYKLTNNSTDIRNNWTMRKDFIVEPTGEYDWIFYKEVNIPGITKNSTVKITPKNLEEIAKCGMSSLVDLHDGKVTVYTLRPPTVDIECLVEIFENGDGSGVLIAFKESGDYVKNIVDGSAKGSVRTIGSCKEFDNGDEDFYKVGQYAFAEGYETMACKAYSHAEGYNTYAGGNASHVEGGGSGTLGRYSHAEGYSTSAEGHCSHTEGNYTEGKGNCSHAEGYYTIASGANQHVQGKYNIEDTENKYADIVGNGTNDASRSNAYTLDWSGNGTFAGTVTVGIAPVQNMDVATKQYVDNAIEEAIVKLAKQ